MSLSVDDTSEMLNRFEEGQNCINMDGVWVFIDLWIGSCYLSVYASSEAKQYERRKPH